MILLDYLYKVNNFYRTNRKQSGTRYSFSHSVSVRPSPRFARLPLPHGRPRYKANNAEHGPRNFESATKIKNQKDQDASRYAVQVRCQLVQQKGKMWLVGKICTREKGGGGHGRFQLKRRSPHLMKKVIQWDRLFMASLDASSSIAAARLA